MSIRCLKKIEAWLLISMSIAVFSGCKQIAEVAAPEAQEVSAQVQMQTIVETDRIYDNISINEIPVGGMTKEEAIKKVTEELTDPLKSQKIIIKMEEKTWPLELTRLDYDYDIEKGVEEAFNIARTGTIEERYDKIMELEASPYKITLAPKYDKTQITRFLEEIAQEVDQPAIEPSAKRENKEIKTTSGSNGIAVNIDETKAKIEEFADKVEGGEVLLTCDTVEPKFSEEDFLKGNSLIGTFSTPVTGSASRDVNLTVASNYINGVTIYPNEIFSTNETIGETTYDRGYRVAPVIVNGKLEDGMGGGVCQVSSTLYNSVLFAELEIVERMNHSLMVGYAPAGRDATLAGTYIDFKFRNNTEYPIYVESYLEGKRLYVNLYGYETRPANRKVELYTVSLGDLAYDVFKKISVDGVVTETVHINRSKYKPPTPAEPEPAPEVPATEAPAGDAAVEQPGTAPEPEVDNSVMPEWLNVQPQPEQPPVQEPVQQPVQEPIQPIQQEMPVEEPPAA